MLAVAVMLSGCKKDDLSLGDVDPNDGTMISLKMGDQEVIETRSGASVQELTIADAYVLVFRSAASGGTPYLEVMLSKAQQGELKEIYSR